MVVKMITSEIKNIGCYGIKQSTWNALFQKDETPHIIFIMKKNMTFYRL
jgi:hypothetical protein